MRQPIVFWVKDLRRILREWDVLGVAEVSAHDDEYDCLLGPLMTRLAAGADVDEIACFLAERVDGHFGLESDEDNISVFAATVVAWWVSEPRDGIRERRS